MSQTTLEICSPKTSDRPARRTETAFTKSITDDKQRSLELAIIDYQAALTSNNKRLVSQCYDRICTLYPPLSFVHVWFKKYRYLYDSREDFIQDYLRIFCTCLAAWQPRNTRKESKWGGSGKFANFFWSALNNSYINMVKQESSGKRNLSAKCPICDGWANPLSSHLLVHHEHLLWESMESFGMAVDEIIHCPLCKSHRVTRIAHCSHSGDGPACESCRFTAANQSLRRHLLAMHSTYLFDRFRNLHPHHVTTTSKPGSIYQESDDGGDYNLYDNTPNTNHASMLLNCDLTPIQRLMIERVYNGALSLPYDADLYNCTRETFQCELDALQQLLILCGVSAGVED